MKALDQAVAPDAFTGCETAAAVSVFDVWDSMEQFQKFGETLVPIMKKLGADPGQPQT